MLIIKYNNLILSPEQCDELFQNKVIITESNEMISISGLILGSTVGVHDYKILVDDVLYDLRVANSGIFCNITTYLSFQTFVNSLHPAPSLVKRAI
jgi:hypothetical protein